MPVADAYASMRALWHALSEHETGASPGSIWDTYESGERRLLERRLAETYGAPAATAVCTGMTGVMNALMAASLAVGGALEEPRYCGHYEILDLFEGVLGRLGSRAEVGVRVVEPVTNDPTLRVHTHALGEPASAVVIDNSLFSISLPWEVWSSRSSSPLLVVESIPKFLCREANGGVIFGEEDLVAAVRDLSRRTGTLMSRAASTAVLGASIELAADRVRQHAANAELFAEALARRRPDLEVRIPHQVARSAGLEGACSSLVFLIYPPGASVLEQFEAWAGRAERLLGRPMVRHGYGWTKTYGRAYGPNKLNAPAGTEYIRFSVGLEPPDVLAELAELMTA
ncbi:MAG: hypothetical protein ACJ76S_03995 [Solirubrobacteraceae bacterium]